MLHAQEFSDGSVVLSFFVFFIYTLWSWVIILPPEDNGDFAYMPYFIDLKPRVEYRPTKYLMAT